MKKAPLFYAAMLLLATGLAARFAPSSVVEGVFTHTQSFEKQQFMDIANACGELTEVAVGTLSGTASFEACNPDVISIGANGIPTSTSDVQYMVQREVCGNGELMVRVLSVSGGKAGLELRADNAPGAVKAGLKTNLSNFVDRIVRTQTNAAQNSQQMSAPGQPWLKIVRNGNSIVTYTSANGSTWNQAAAYTLSLPACVQAGVLMQSVNNATTHTGAFSNLTFSGFSLPSGPATTLSFAADTLQAAAGDTVQVCVNIADACACSPASVQVALQGSGSPHLRTYSAQTLQFQNGDTQKCFSLPIAAAPGNGTYTLSLQNAVGGNGASVGNTPLVLAVTGSPAGEAISFCGVIPPHTASSTHPDSILYDRFGNTYDRYPRPEDIQSRLADNHICTAGYFELRFSDQFPSNQEQLICQVFTDVSQLIPRRLSVTACGDELSNPVVIEIKPSPAASYLAAASPYFIAPSRRRFNCQGAVTSSMIHDVINGGDTDDTFGTDAHGVVYLSTTVAWYTGQGNPGMNEYDLYSVILHEIGHLLGFASNLGLEDPTDFYTTWDKNLFLHSSYLPGQPNNNGESILHGNCVTNCLSLTIPVPDLVSLANNNCLNTSPVIAFGNAAIAPLYGGNGMGLPPAGTQERIAEFRNRMSHLRSSCNGAHPSYVMQPSIASGETRRVFTQDELQVLCKLGFQVAGACNGCYVTTRSDGDIFSRIINNSQITCCDAQEYYLCVGEPRTIAFEELLCNDFTNASGPLQITDVFLEVANPGIAQVSIVPAGIRVVANQPFNEVFLVYTVTGCDCVQRNNHVIIKAGPCNLCNNVIPCNNMLCEGSGFQQFPVTQLTSVTVTMLGGHLWAYQAPASGVNTPDICQETNGNRYLQLGSSNAFPELGPLVEGVHIPLTEPISPGCEITINFRASRSAVSAMALLDVYGSSSPPCSLYPDGDRVNLGCVPTDCGDYIFNPVCISQVPISHFTSAGFCPGNVNWGQYEITWTNTTGNDLHFLIFSSILAPGDRLIYLDDITVAQNCLDPSFDAVIDGCQVYFTALQPNAENYQHLWDFGDGSGSAQINPSHSYQPGVYEVVHTVIDECGRERSAILTLTIQNCCIAPPPAATFEAGASDDCGLFRFRILTQGSGALTFTWNVDGQTYTGPEAEHTFTASGDYLLTLIATNICGQSVVYTQNIEVKLPTADAAFSPGLAAPLQSKAIAIRADGSSAVQGAEIRNNTVSTLGSDFGIYTNACAGFEIDQNIVDVLNADNSQGILMAGGTDNILSNNTVTGLLGTGNGVRLNGAGNIRLWCNTLSALSMGLQLSGQHTGADIATTLFRTPMGTGLRYANGVLAPQQNGRGNRWEGTAQGYSVAAARHEGDDVNDIQGAAYRILGGYDPTQSFNTYPPSVQLTNFPGLPVTTWFPTNGMAAVVCATQPQLQDNEEENAKLRRLIAVDSLGSIPDGTKWDAAWALYRKLLEEPQLMAEDSLLAAFFHRIALLPPGKLAMIEQGKAELFAPNDLTGIISGWVADLKSISMEIRLIDSLVVADSLEWLPAQWYALMEEAKQISDAIQILSAQADSLRREDAALLLLENAGISAIQLPEANWQVINEIYLKSIVAGKFSFSEGQKDTIIAIASQCPELGGSAVFAARALQALFDPETVYEEFIPCASTALIGEAGPAPTDLSGELKFVKMHESASWVSGIFPNPAGEYFLVAYDTEYPVRMYIYDMYGKVRRSLVLPSGRANSETINTSDLESGVYVVSLSNAGGEVVNIRLLVVK